MLSVLNVNWFENWFDVSTRPKSPAPLSVIMFAIFFYANAFFLIPKYFSSEKWKAYLLGATLLFLVPELIRLGIYSGYFGTSISDEIFTRDSFFFGAPSAFFFALNSSFIYRLTIDWFKNKNHIKQLEKQSNDKASTKPYENKKLISEQEKADLMKNLNQQIKVEKLFLKPDLTLRELAESMGTSEKKLSYFINQELESNFYELLNKDRIAHFKTEVLKPENESLSIVGLAQNCGFPSKSSFYRAFKAEVGVSPSAYIKTLKSQ